MQIQLQLQALCDLFLDSQEKIKQVRDSLRKAEVLPAPKQFALLKEKVSIFKQLLNEIEQKIHDDSSLYGKDFPKEVGFSFSHFFSFPSFSILFSHLKAIPKLNFEKLVSPIPHPDTDDNPNALFDLLDFKTHVNKSFEETFGFKMPILLGTITDQVFFLLSQFSFHSHIKKEFQHICARNGTIEHDFALLVEQALFFPTNKGEGEQIVKGNTDRFVTSTLTFQNKILGLLGGKEVIQYARGVAMDDVDSSFISTSTSSSNSMSISGEKESFYTI